jgi:very-short-patch-repair endonuclease
LTTPELNVEMRINYQRIEVDCVWREKRLIAELDGRDAHHSLPAFESDALATKHCFAAGWRVVRVTSRRLRPDATRLAAELRTLTS